MGAKGGRRNMCELQTVCYIATHVSITLISSILSGRRRMMSVFHVSCVAFSAGFLKQANHTVELQSLAGKTHPELHG